MPCDARRNVCYLVPQYFAFHSLFKTRDINHPTHPDTVIGEGSFVVTRIYSLDVMQTDIYIYTGKQQVFKCGEIPNFNRKFILCGAVG